MKIKNVKKGFLTLLLIVPLLIQVFGQKKLFDETVAEKQVRMAWWVHDRFGMFIHWGLYALPARHEWVKNRENDLNLQLPVN